MIREITFFAEATVLNGLTPSDKLHGLSPLVVLAGPNGCGKSRHLSLLPSLVQPLQAIQGNILSIDQHIRQYNFQLQNLETNKNQMSRSQYNREFSQIKIGIETNQRYLAFYKCLERDTFILVDGPSGLQRPEVKDRIIDLSYAQPDKLTGCANIDNISNVYSAVNGNISGGFAQAQNSANEYVYTIADAMFHADNYHGPNHAELEDAIADANGFNQIIYSLLGTRIEYSVEYRIGRPMPVPVFRGRSYNASELSKGERILLNWSILLHRQKQFLRDAILTIDEPENHLHSDNCVRALTALRDEVLGPRGQIWIATHSVPLVAFAGMASVIFVDGGKAQYAGNQVDRVIDRLLGGAEQRDKLRAFLSSAEDLGFYEFAAQCLTPATVVPAKTDDPQQIQFATLVRERAMTPEGLRIMDFGAGRGRLAVALYDAWKKFDHSAGAKLHYYSVNDASLSSEEELLECQSNIQRLATLSGVKAKSLQSLRELSGEASQSVDIVVLCNVFHEIPIEDWICTAHDIANVLSDDGIMLLMEDQLPTIGELPHKDGFVILDLHEVRKLFNAGIAVSLVSSGRGGRLTAIEIPKAYLQCINPLTISQTLKLVRDRAIKSITELRRTSQLSFQEGRKHAFYSLLHINATLCMRKYSPD